MAAPIAKINKHPEKTIVIATLSNIGTPLLIRITINTIEYSAIKNRNPPAMPSNVCLESISL